MKKLAFLLAGFLFTGLTVQATPIDSKLAEITSAESNYVRGYGKNFIFLEGGIEFSVFPDGQFDFNMSRHHSNFNVSINTPGTSISYNSGYDYDSYVQYDEYGAVVQIENVPVFYDHYGRISQAGNIFISYNQLGFISRLGGLHINYNRYNRFSHCSGFINVYNRAYVYRPWHSYYAIPRYNYCVVYNRPYRQHYRPIRYHYSNPYRNNFRRRSAVASRRGHVISRHSRYASRTNGRKRANYNYSKRPGRTGVANTSRPRGNTTNTTRPTRGITKGNSNGGRPRTNTSSTRPTRGNTIGNSTRPTRPVVQNRLSTRPSSRPTSTRPQTKSTSRPRRTLSTPSRSQNRVTTASKRSTQSSKSQPRLAQRSSKRSSTSRSLNSRSGR